MNICITDLRNYMQVIHEGQNYRTGTQEEGVSIAQWKTWELSLRPRLGSQRI